ncbi:MAG: N-acetylglucosamine-6-phosphate deacetylase [Acidobacteria bacterium]|nr:N-acetylglucosamine-6-phosphate deacetylase [Acidobacteriota bacterium]
MLLALTASALITPREVVSDGVVIVRDGTIEAVGTRAQIEIPVAARVENYESGILAPGYIDLHIHGGAGHDLMEAAPVATEAVERLLAQHGVTSYLPTTLTAPVDLTLRALEFLAAEIEAAAADQSRSDRACPAGIHMEGPFLSHAKRGVHPPEYLQPASVELFQRFWEAARGHIRLLTIAPELPDAAELISVATRQGITCSLGHSNALAAEAQAGVAAGARHATHTFNAMRPLDHREPGILGVVLGSPELYADIIADGVHVEPSVIDMFLRLKGPERAVLITDALSATGMGEGRFRLGDFEIDVRGPVCRDLNGTIAGSVLTLDVAVRNIMAFTGWELPAAVRLASLNAARSAQLAGRGELVAGAVADIAVLTPAGEVMETICGGRTTS